MTDLLGQGSTQFNVSSIVMLTQHRWTEVHAILVDDIRPRLVHIYVGLHKRDGYGTH